ncbi:subtilisin family serine protease [Saccharomonospora amisosensis]|uniref:Subtilisin family serine protease n=1 Tax=Saccharomonospora amisosensis TaxID=1128677 RepID=A0A7X5USB2_9PSEU|nr:subtilisin family serine protease [Saccharomonospora amisosensis]
MRGRGSVVLACVTLALSGHLGVTSATAAPASPCDLDGPRLRYVVLFDKGTTAPGAQEQVRAACGTVTGYYPEIAVGVAVSSTTLFAERIGPDRAFSAEAARLARRGTWSALPRNAPRIPALTGMDVATDDRTAEQWNLRAINATAAHNVDVGNRDVVVGVLDSGIDPTHPDLAGTVDADLSAGCLSGSPDRARSAWEPTTSAHGTHVAGILAAADDGRGVTGVAPGVRLASVKVIDEHGYVDPEAAVCGLLWAARNGMQVANSSFLVAPWPTSCASGSGQQVVHEALARAVEYAEAAGTLTVAAATNEGVQLTRSNPSGLASESDSSTCEALPAGLPQVMAVSSVDRAGLKAPYSSHGLGVIDLTAPGGGTDDCVLSTVPSGYESMCGTSMAAPHVAGVAALLASRLPGATPQQLRAALTGQASPLGCPTDYDLAGDGTQDAYCTGYSGYNSFYGHGMVDALATVSAVPAGSAQQQAVQPARRSVEPEYRQHEQVREVPEHRDVEHADGQSPGQFDAVIQREALHDYAQHLGIDGQWVEGR